MNVTLDGRPPTTGGGTAGGGTTAGGTTGGGTAGGGATGGGTTAREVVIYNMVTNGPTQMREDDAAAYLSTVTQNYCKRDGCALPNTDMRTGFRIAALCQTTGARTTNGWDASGTDDTDPGLYTSTRWYRMRWADGLTGYLSEVCVAPKFRGGLGLPGC